MQDQRTEQPWRITVNGQIVQWWTFATREEAERQAAYHGRNNEANPFGSATYGVTQDG